MTMELTVKDIDNLLGSFRELQKACLSKLATKDEGLWEKYQQEAKHELEDKVKQKEAEVAKASGFGSVGSWGRTKINTPQPAEKEIDDLAEEKYRERNMKYAEVLKSFYDKIEKKLKEIYRVIYPVQQLLQAEACTRDTLLRQDWRKITPYSFVNELMEFQGEKLIQNCIDALEVIKYAVERKQKVKLTGELPPRQGARQNHKQTETPKSHPKEVPWNNNDPNYMYASKAIVAFTGGKMPATTLSKKVRHPDNNSIQFMNKAQRCKVHIGNFREWAEKHYPPDELASEITDEYMSDVEARKKYERLQGQKKRTK